MGLIESVADKLTFVRTKYAIVRESIREMCRLVIRT